MIWEGYIYQTKAMINSLSAAGRLVVTLKNKNLHLTNKK